MDGVNMKDIKVELGMIIFGIQMLLLAGFRNIFEQNVDVNTTIIIVILSYGLQVFGIIKLNEKLNN